VLNRKRILNESQAAKVLKQVLLAVNYLHGKKIVHRDLKPENLMLEKENHWDLKVIDFGLSKVFNKDKKMN
jgi:serine/threonine protein kinase